MMWKIIQESEEKPAWSPPVYKKDRPPDTLLVISDGTRAVVRDWIGPGLDYWFEGLGIEDLSEQFEGEDPGVWIWEGYLRSDEIRTQYGSGVDYDLYLDGDVRPLTDEEWNAFRDEQTLWDRSRWLEDTDDEDRQDQARPGDEQ